MGRVPQEGVREAMKLHSVELPDNLFFPSVLDCETVAGIVGVRPSNAFTAVGLDGKIKWSTELEKSCTLGAIDAARIWLHESRAILQLDASGMLVSRELLRLEKHERIGCLAVADDALFVSVYREKEATEVGRSPRVLRLTMSFEEVWSTRLPIDKIAYSGCSYMGVDTGWEEREMPPWKPSSWLPFGDDQLLISGDRLLASFQEMPRSGIGCRYVIDVESGALTWKSHVSPISNAYSLGGGRFLLGDQGYGAFETTLFDENASEPTRWASHGHDFEIGGGLFSVQMSNDLSVPQHLVQLCDDGQVRLLGGRLPGYYSSKPVSMADGNVYFWRADNLWSWEQANGLTSSHQFGFGDGAYASSLQFSDRRVGFNIRHRQPNQAEQRVFMIAEI